LPFLASDSANMHFVDSSSSFNWLIVIWNPCIQQHAVQFLHNSTSDYSTELATPTGQIPLLPPDWAKPSKIVIFCRKCLEDKPQKFLLSYLSPISSYHLAKFCCGSYNIYGSLVVLYAPTIWQSLVDSCLMTSIC